MYLFSEWTLDSIVFSKYEHAQKMDFYPYVYVIGVGVYHPNYLSCILPHLLFSLLTCDQCPDRVPFRSVE